MTPPPVPNASNPLPAMNDFVLQVPLHTRDDLSPNAKRAVLAGMVGAHVLAGWALLQVPAVRDAVTEAMPTMMVELIAPEPVKPPPPPPKTAPKPPPPAPVLAAKPRPVPEVPPPFVAPPPPPEPPPLAAPTAPPAPVAPPAPPAPPAPAPAAPRVVQLSSTDWIREPDLNYPLASQRLGEQGTATVRAVFDVKGKPTQVLLLKSSGFPRLDQEALNATRRSLVKPLLENGVPIVFAASFQLEFNLDR